MLSAQQIIERLDLIPHPEEGSYFRESYRCQETLPGEAFKGYKKGVSKCLGTAIYYLLTPETCSRLHRLPADEIFHFYMGDPVAMLLLYPDGSSQEITLGQNILKGQQVQVVVPKGVWQGSYLLTDGQYALMGTTMAPGFDYTDYEAGQRQELTEQYPDRRDWVRRLTPEDT